MNNKKLTLHRKTGNLWIDEDRGHIACIWNVTKLEKIMGIDPSGVRIDPSGVRIFSKGEQLGIVWDVKKIEETWI